MTTSSQMHLPERAAEKVSRRAGLLGLVLLAAAGCGAGDEARPQAPGVEIAATEVGVQAVATSGAAAPDGRGRIESLGAPLLNNRGQVLFVAEIDAPRADVNDSALIRSDGPGQASQLVRTGQTLPGGERFGWVTAPADALAFNDAGQVAVLVAHDADWNDVHALYRIEADGEIVTVFHPAEQGATHAGRPLINGKGQIAFEVSEEGDHGLLDDRRVERVGPDGTRMRLFGRGDPTPDGEYALSTAIQLGSRLTESGWVSFYAAPNPLEPGGSPTQAFYRSDGSGLVELARRGTPAALPGEHFEQLQHVRSSDLDGDNRSVFYARTRVRGTPAAHGVLFMHTGTGVVALARQGDQAPGGGEFQSPGGVTTSMNSSGQVAFRASTTGGQVIFLAGPDGGLVRVAGPGSPLPGGDTIAGSVARPVVNERGQVAFYAHTEGGGRAVIVAEPGRSLRLVVRTGQTLDGARVHDLDFAGNEPGRSGFNDHGQVAFLARLEDDGGGRDVIFLAHPDAY